MYSPDIPLEPMAAWRLLLELGLFLLAGRALGGLARRSGLPSVAGELLAGICLGPTLLGHLWPAGLEAFMGRHPFLLSGLSPLAAVQQVALVAVMFAAGLQVDASTLRRQGKQALALSLCGYLATAAIGYTIAGYIYHIIPGVTEGGELVFRLFIGVALSATALPVVVRNLVDQGRLRSRQGGLLLSVAMIDDPLTWLLFSAVLAVAGLLGTTPEGLEAARALVSTSSPNFLEHLSGNNSLGGRALFTDMVAGLAALSGLLILVRLFAARLLPLAGGPGSRGAICLGLALLAGAASELAGLHAAIGAFWLGMALASRGVLEARLRESLHLFTINIFAPLYFVLVGVSIDFAHHFDLGITAMIALGALAGKTIGGTLSAVLTGESWSSSLTLGLAMNARGPIEILLATIALERNLINQDVFVALVISAILTGFIAGTARLDPAKEKKLLVVS